MTRKQIVTILVAFLAFVIGICYSMTIRNATEYLERKFEAKMDINYYFYDQYKTQMNNQNACHSGNGPYCLPINNQTFASKPFDSPANML